MLPPVNTTIASVGLRQLRSWWGRKPDQPRKPQQPHDGTCDRDAAQGALRQRYCRAPGHLLELRHIVGSISYRQTFAEPRCGVAEKRNLARFTRLRAASSRIAGRDSVGSNHGSGAAVEHKSAIGTRETG
jgi:hypothetical protein